MGGAGEAGPSAARAAEAKPLMRARRPCERRLGRAPARAAGVRREAGRGAWSEAGRGGCVKTLPTLIAPGPDSPLHGALGATVTRRRRRRVAIGFTTTVGPRALAPPGLARQLSRMRRPAPRP